jgi:hypothetical protein
MEEREGDCHPTAVSTPMSPRVEGCGAGGTRRFVGISKHLWFLCKFHMAW